MDGYDKLKETAKEIGKQVMAVKVEGHDEIAKINRTMAITGLEEVPTNMIPLPFYKLVQPGSTNVALVTGTDAVPGTIYMKDTRESVGELKFALLRAKRQLREFTNNNGELVRTVSMGMLGVKIDGFSPFLINVSVASFGNFGQLMKQLKDRKVSRAWEYPIIMRTEKREEMKEIGGRAQKVKYWVLTFEVAKDKLDDTALSLLDDAYAEFASSLDRAQTEETSSPRILDAGDGTTEPTPF
jgi:hypothetical protein